MADRMDKAILQKIAWMDQQPGLRLDDVDATAELLDWMRDMGPKEFARMLLGLALMAHIRARPDVASVLDDARALLESGWPPDKRT